MKEPSLVIICPCRNEAEYAETTLKSLVQQTRQPDLLIIVDDGSTDKTPDILKRYSSEYNWIKVVTKKDRGHRSVGPGVIETFYAGYAECPREATYICKLDLDLDLPPRYFEILLNLMESNPRLGTCSGKPYFRDSLGNLISEKCADDNSVGMTKLYRHTCFKEIGGFVRQVMWDAIDGHLCRMHGWRAISHDAEALRFIHLRPMGSSQVGIVHGRLRLGFGQWFMGTHPAYLIASALFRISHFPPILGSIATTYSYFQCAVRRRPRLSKPFFGTYLRRYQLRTLCFGRLRTMARFEAGSSLRKKAARHQHAQEAKPDSVILAGIPIHRISSQELIKRILFLISENKGALVVTPNVDHLRRAHMDREWRRLLISADFRVPDGIPLLWAANIQGQPLRGRVNGTDLFESLIEICSKEKIKMALIGGEPGSAIATSSYISDRFGADCPSLCPTFGFETTPDGMKSVTSFVLHHKPKVVFLGLGSPKQERIGHELKRAYPSAVYIGIGVSFSFVGGIMPRAPKWAQKLGLEWLYRLSQEPKRLFSRYILHGLPFLIQLLLRSATLRLIGNGAGR